MRHIGVFAKPIGGLYWFSTFYFTYNTCWLPHLVFLVINLIGIEHISILIVRLTFIVHEEVYAGCQEVHSRSLEELVATTTAFFLSLL